MRAHRRTPTARGSQAMNELRFDVFGQRVAVARGVDGWVAFLLGSDGKRRPADFVIPDFIDEPDLAQFLADLFHEAATSRRGAVRRLP